MLWNNILAFLLAFGKGFSIEKCPNPGGSSLFQEIKISPFVDRNRYVRLNISWDKPQANFTSFDMDIKSICTNLYGDKGIPIERDFIVQPNMARLTHPAEPLLHGCPYVFEFNTLNYDFNNKSCLLSQTVDYTIPDCVQFVCACNVTSSPYELTATKLIGDKLYSIEFNKTDSFNGLSLEDVFYNVWYTNIDSNKTVSLVPVEQINFDNDQLKLRFNDLHEGNSYSVYVDLIVDNCEFHFTTVISVPRISRSSIAHTYSIYFGISCGLCAAVAAVLLKIRPEIMEKLRKYLPFHTSDELTNNGITCGPSNGISRKEVINSQYTPLEFIVNSHKFDRFEVPRCRIALKQQIGGGAFGKVYKAELYDRTGITSTAVKKPIDSVPPEEVADFLGEIETMKKLENSGGHPNVVKLLACVTSDPPYLMVMELVPCGSLKSYLSDLRRTWEVSRRRGSSQRHFFPDNMVVENYLPCLAISPVNDDQLKYSHLDFQDRGSRSYVAPDTPSSPGSPLKPNGPTLRSVTPNSLTSSGLPSVTETLLTPLDAAEPVTALIDRHDAIKPNLDSKDLHDFALQIANGMAFLERLGIAHRDLAARNILIDRGKTLKISDFGMARKGVYVNTANKRQPLRWMAPEAIECRKCDNKSDVWSFGVVLWEIGSLGAFPYSDLSNENVITYVIQGRRLARPETCTDQLYDLMRECWRQDPEKRPTFGNIAAKLAGAGKIYVEFGKLPPKYVFPPAAAGKR